MSEKQVSLFVSASRLSTNKSNLPSVSSLFIFFLYNFKGFDHNTKTYEVDGQKIKLQIWDTAGQEKCNSITQTFYKGAHGVILTYSINDRKSFENLETWLNQVKIHGGKNVCKIIVGNKNDTPDRVISREEGENFAKKHKIAFLETSAKENFNVTEVFEALAKDIKVAVFDKEIVNSANPSVRLHNKKNESSCWDRLWGWFSNLFKS